MAHSHRSWRALALVLAALAALAPAPQAGLVLGKPEALAPGVELYRASPRDLLDPPGTVSVQLLRIDPSRVELSCALAQDQVLGVETVAGMARRHGAIAAVNAGFFVPSGDPAGVMKLKGEVVSDMATPRGAVAITRPAAGQAQELVFDQVAVALELDLQTDAGRTTVRADGVDTVRPPGQLVWFTPRFNDHIDTTTAGTDWILRGSPLAVVERRPSALRTIVPADGAVLSYGGDTPPAPLDGLSARDTARPFFSFTTARGTDPAVWAQAPDAVGGAGLLMSRGEPVRDWEIEKLRPGFATERHPRTMIGVDGDRRIWLVTVDGRNPLVSLGMSFVELQALARALRLREALNLDGGGSTTMVVNGVVVNHPSDAAGPRRVSDAILLRLARRQSAARGDAPAATGRSQGMPRPDR